MHPSNPWRQRLLSVAVAAAAALGPLAIGDPAGAQSRDRTLIVSALDKNGKAVDALAPGDVVVREDGVRREVLRVGPPTAPMQVALLVDNSTAIDSHVADFREALVAFVGRLHAQHQVSLVTYADRPTLVASFSTDRSEVVKGIERIFAQPNSGGYLLDAIQETAQGFIKRESPRPVIVVVGTEGVEFSNAHYQSVLERLKTAGAQLHVLQLTDVQPDTTQEQRYRSIVIDRGTRETGGRRDHLLASMALTDALTGLAEELNGQFQVVYSSPDSLIPPREVTVTSARPDLEVRGMVLKAKS